MNEERLIHLIWILPMIIILFIFVVDRLSKEDFNRMCELTCPELGYTKLEWFCEDHDCYCEEEDSVIHCHYFFED